MRSGRCSEGWLSYATRPADAVRLIVLLGRTLAGRGLFDVFRHPELPERMAPADVYPWAEPDDPSAVTLCPANGFLDALVVGDVIVMIERVSEASTRRPSAVGMRVRGVDREGNRLFTRPAVAAERGMSDMPRLRLLGDGQRVRVAFSYHQSGPSRRLAYVDIYDPAARGDVRPQTVRLPTDGKLEWVGGTAVQGGLSDHGGPITILDADGTLSPWHRPGWRPVAATADVVVDADRNDDVGRGFQVLDRRTRRVLWSRRRQNVYAVSTHAIIAGRSRRLRLYDLTTGRVIARSNDALPQGGTPTGADGTRQHGDLLMAMDVAASTRHRWVHGGWNIGYYAIWQDDLYGFEPPEHPYEKNPMALWIPPTGTPAKFPVTGHAAPLGVTTDGHAIALTGTFRDRALYALSPRQNNIALPAYDS